MYYIIKNAFVVREGVTKNHTYTHKYTYNVFIYLFDK